MLEEEEDVLQAVVLADSFNWRIQPLTAKRPRCLLPVCGASLLDWTFESLALAGVQEVFVVCRSHSDLIKEAIAKSKWSSPSSGLKKIQHIQTARETFSHGDIMRDIYAHGIIKSDFVLVAGDLVSNVRIDEVVRAHKARRKVDKDAIMTVVVKQAGAYHRTRPRGETSIFALDAATSECLHYHASSAYPIQPLVHLPREIIRDHPDIDIRNDLVDCLIDVCSVEVPSLFQDNFDYQDLRRDFLYGVLTSDLLTYKIFCHVVADGYAARVRDTRSYAAISKDILSRWTFPLVPDDNHPGGHNYELERGNRYIAKGGTVILSQTCKVSNNSLIGSHTRVYDAAQIIRSVVGQHCDIGPQTALTDAYVWDGSTMGSGCSVNTAIIGENVRLGENCKIGKGALIGDGVRLGAGSVIQPFAKVSVPSNKPFSDDDDDEWVAGVPGQGEYAATILGPDSVAVLWPTRQVTVEDEDENPIENCNNLRTLRLGDTYSDLELTDGGSETDSSMDSEDSDDDLDGLDAGSSTTSLPTVSLAQTTEQAQAAEFMSECSQSLARAFDEGHSVDNAAVELKTLRMASNVPIRRVREAIVGFLVDRAVDTGAGDRNAVARIVQRWGPLLNAIGSPDAVDVLAILQAQCARSEGTTGVFGSMLIAMFNTDIVDEIDVRRWHAMPQSRGTNDSRMAKCWMIGQAMVQRFDEESSEEESE